MSTFPLPDISLEGRAIIVTGGDRGLGRSMALAMAQCGASVVIASVDKEGCERVAAEIGDSGLVVPLHQGAGICCAECGFPPFEEPAPSFYI